MTMVHDSQVDWREGADYLLFLRLEDTPFEDGSERAWTVLWQGHGSFISTDTGWTNFERTVSLRMNTLTDQLAQQP